MKNSILIISEKEKIQFSNTYNMWDDAFYYFPKAGDEINIKIRKHKNDVSIEFFSPYPYTNLDSFKKTYTYEQFNKLNIKTI